MTTYRDAVGGALGQKRGPEHTLFSFERLHEPYYRGSAETQKIFENGAFGAVFENFFKHSKIIA